MPTSRKRTNPSTFNEAYELALTAVEWDFDYTLANSLMRNFSVACEADSPESLMKIINTLKNGRGTS